MEYQHTALGLCDDGQVRTWDATRLDGWIPRPPSRDTSEQNEQTCGGADDCKNGNDDVGVPVVFSMLGRCET